MSGEQVFLSPRELKDHLHFVHWGRLVQLCDFCGETFFHSEQLSKHKKNFHSSVVDQIVEIPMKLKSFEKDNEEEDYDVLAETEKWNVGTSPNNSAIDKLLSEIGQGNLEDFTRAYIGTVRKHLDFKHHENFTDCLDCFKEDPLSVLFAGKSSGLQPSASFHRQDTFDQLWMQNAMRKEKQVFEIQGVAKDPNSDWKAKEGESDLEEMDLGESDYEDLAEDFEDYEDSEEIGFEKTDNLVGTNYDNKNIVDEKETKAREDKQENKIDPDKKSGEKMNTICNKAPQRRRLYGF